MSRDSPTSNELLASYIEIYMQSANKSSQEIEAVFGNRISRIDFENVISKLKSLGFNNFESEGSYHLNIQNQFIDKRTGKTTIGNIRTTISGISAIQEYCKTNTFDLDNPPHNITFMQKCDIYTKGSNLYVFCGRVDFRICLTHIQRHIL